MNIEQVIKDFIPFCDPATTVKSEHNSDVLQINMIRNGEEQQYLIQKNTGSVHVSHKKNKKFISIASLLASDYFADLKTMAETQQRLTRYDREKEINYIMPEGTIDGAELHFADIVSKISPSSSPVNKKLKLFLLDGPAGVGKTSLITKILKERSNAYNDGSLLPPILHVSSRGRRLAGLNDALAQSIQILRAKFTFDQVPVLIRYGLLQVAIDGFDELG
jgi:hypothetical protein